MTEPFRPAGKGLRTRLFQIIFESDTPLAKGFDIALIVMILASVLVVMLDSVAAYAAYGEFFYWLEWVFTLLFTVELALRIYCLEKPWRYMRSFYGVVDVLAVLPTWLMLILPGNLETLVIVRLLRVLRIFRVLRLMQFVGESRLLLDALRRSARQITLFFASIFMLVTIFAAVMYTIESPEAGFTSIPMSIYWAIVSLTTVGYGDIVPMTPLGKAITVMLMLIGYSIIAVPTGVFSAQVIRSIREERYSDEACPGCGHDHHERRARYCLLCGTWLNEETRDPNAPETSKGDTP